MKRIIFSILVLFSISAYSQDSLVVTSGSVAYKVNPIQSDTVAIGASKVEFQFSEPKGIKIYPSHYKVDGSSYTLIYRPEPTFVSKAQLDAVAPGVFDNMEKMILGNLQQQAIMRTLYDTNQWIKKAK